MPTAEQLKQQLAELDALARALAEMLREGAVAKTRTGACRDLLKRVFTVTLGGEQAIDASDDPAAITTSFSEALNLARAIDSAIASQTGPTFYTDRRLGVIAIFDPIRIKSAIDERIIGEVFQRYYYEQTLELRMESLVRRLEGAGYKVPEAKSKLPEDFKVYRELIWGRVTDGPR